MNNGPKIYVASKTYHAPLWQEYRKLYNITSTWIDEAGEGQSPDLKDLAHRCVREAQECDVMIVYSDGGDYLKGAFIEMGVALASNKPVILVNTVLREGSVFTRLPNVRQAPSIEDAFLMTESMEWLDESELLNIVPNDERTASQQAPDQGDAAGLLISSLQAEVEHLRSWKAQAIACTPDWQAIGKALNLKLGTSVSDQVLPSILNLLKDRRELVIALRRLQCYCKGQVKGYQTSTRYREVEEILDKHHHSTETL